MSLLSSLSLFPSQGYSTGSVRGINTSTLVLERAGAVIADTVIEQECRSNFEEIHCF